MITEVPRNIGLALASIFDITPTTSFYRRSRRDTTANAIYEILTAKLQSNLPSKKLRVAYSKLITTKAPEAFRSQLLTTEIRAINDVTVVIVKNQQASDSTE